MTGIVRRGRRAATEDVLQPSLSPPDDEVEVEQSEEPEETAEEETPSTERPERSENFLALYFKEMASLSVLKPEEEMKAARGIEQLELQLWAHLLTYPPLLDVVLAAVDRGVEDELKEVELLRGHVRLLRKASTVSRKHQYRVLAEQASERIYAADQDRRVLLVVLGELRKITRGDRSLVNRTATQRVNLRCKAFKDYAKHARVLFNAAQRSRNDFVKANLRLVVSIARRYNHGRMPLSDLIQEGNIGLIKAVERFDYHRGYRFSTYASWWIRHAISRALADKGRAVRLPVHMLDAYHKVSRAKRDLSTKLGRAPSIDEIACAAGLLPDKVEKIQGYLTDQTVSLDRTVSEDDDRRFVELLEDCDMPLISDRLVERSVNDQVREIMSHLKPIEADVLRMRFGLHGGQEQTLKEIGDSYQLSRERIRQIQEQALGKIRRALEVRQVV